MRTCRIVQQLDAPHPSSQSAYAPTMYDYIFLSYRVLPAPPNREAKSSEGSMGGGSYSCRCDGKGWEGKPGKTGMENKRNGSDYVAGLSHAMILLLLCLTFMQNGSCLNHPEFHFQQRSAAGLQKRCPTDRQTDRQERHRSLHGCKYAATNLRQYCRIGLTANSLEKIKREPTCGNMKFCILGCVTYLIFRPLDALRSTLFLRDFRRTGTAAYPLPAAPLASINSWGGKGKRCI